MLLFSDGYYISAYLSFQSLRRKMSRQPTTSILLHGGPWFLWMAIGLAYSLTTFCPVISPNDELIYIVDKPSKLLVPVKKADCALECAQDAAADGGTCRCFNYNQTSSNCSIFNFEPITYAVDQSGNTVAFQVEVNSQH
jgi:hypothetical protein